MDDFKSTNSRPVQNAVARSTEGRAETTGNRTKPANRGGRPKGSRNKPKALVPRDLATQLVALEGVVPDDYIEYMKGVIKEGKTVNAQREIQIMLYILRENLIPAMMKETKPAEGEEMYFRKDVTERLKVWNSLAGMLHQTEKVNDEGNSGKEKPILQIFERSGVNADRLRILIGVESGNMGGNPDGDRGPEVTVRAVPDKLLERPLDVQDREQVEAVGVFDPDSNRNVAQRSDEEEL